MEGLKQRRPVKGIPVKNRVESAGVRLHRDAFPPPAPFVSRALCLPVAQDNDSAEVTSEPTDTPSVLEKTCSHVLNSLGFSAEKAEHRDEVPLDTWGKVVESLSRSLSSSSIATSDPSMDPDPTSRRTGSSIACAQLNKAMKGVAKFGYKTSKKKDDCGAESDPEVSYASAATKAASTWFQGFRSAAKMLQTKHNALMPDALPKPMSERDLKLQRRYLETLTNCTQPVRSLKVMFLGHARNGKTSTLRALAGLSFNANEESTQGATIWSVQNKMVSAEEASWKIMQDAHADHLERELVEKCVTLLREQDEEEDEALCTKMEEDLHVPLPTLPDGLITRLTSQEENGGESPIAPSQRTDSKGLLLSTWDFAGQTDYYIFVHLFLSKLGIYMLCTDLSIWVKDAEDRHEGSVALDFWIGSLCTFAPEATVIIIATKMDTLTAEERIESKSQLQEYLGQRLEGLGDFENNILSNDDLLFFPVSNRTKEGIDLVRTAVEAAALKTLARIPRNIPHCWVHLLACLQKRKDPTSRMAAPTPCITVEALRADAKRCGFAAEGDNDVDQFLEFFQNIGLILHDNVIVCYEPQWLLQAIQKVFRLKRIGRPANALTEAGATDVSTLRRLWPRFSATDINIMFHFLERYRLVVGPFQEKYYIPAFMKSEPPIKLAAEECTEIFFYCHLCLKELLIPFFPRLLGEAHFALSNVEIHHIARNTFTVAFEDADYDYLASFELEEVRMRLLLKTREGPISAVVVERLLKIVQAATRQFSPGLSFQAWMKICCGTLVCLDQLSSQKFVMCKDHEVKTEDLPQWVQDWRRCYIEGNLLTRRKQLSGVSVDYLYSSPLTLKSGGYVARLKIENELQLLSHAAQDEFQLSVSNLTSESLRDAFLRMPTVLVIAAHISDRTGVLVVEDDVGRGVVFPKNEFEHLPLKGVELVVLMACGSVHFLEYIKCFSVISCRGNVFDAAAQLFTRNLCLALSQRKAQGRNTASADTQREAFEFAKSAVRTSTQPWAADSYQFHFSVGHDIPQPIDRPLGVSWRPPERGLGGCVEDFVGREDFFINICQAFKRGRRLVRITGPAGIGKTACGIMFAKYYRLPGRLFDKQLKLTVSESPHSVQALCRGDSNHSILYTGNEELPEILNQKVLSFILPPLPAHEATDLFLHRVYRPISSTDLERPLKDGSVSVEPRTISREELLVCLPYHPVLQQCAGNPALIISTAAKVTAKLGSLFDLVIRN